MIDELEKRVFGVTFDDVFEVVVVDQIGSVLTGSGQLGNAHDFADQRGTEKCQD